MVIIALDYCGNKLYERMISIVIVWIFNKSKMYKASPSDSCGERGFDCLGTQFYDALWTCALFTHSPNSRVEIK